MLKLINRISLSLLLKPGVEASGWTGNQLAIAEIEQMRATHCTIATHLLMKRFMRPKITFKIIRPGNAIASKEGNGKFSGLKRPLLAEIIVIKAVTMVMTSQVHFIPLEMGAKNRREVLVELLLSVMRNMVI